MRKQKIGQLDVKMHNRREELLFRKLEREVGYVFEMIDEDADNNKHQIKRLIEKIDQTLEDFYWLDMVKDPQNVWNQEDFELLFKPELFFD